jgi:tetratricopeptide (TPR) repeat protein
MTRIAIPYRNTRPWSAVAALALICLLMLASTGRAEAQAAATEEQALPAAHQLTGFGYEAQGWNNCGPATLTNALTYFGYTSNQNRAADWLKPNFEDKNVSPWQMTEFVNTQVPERPVYARVRMGGTLDTLKRLLANGFPVIIEKGYDPPPHDLGWMGHYLLLTGYDDASATFNTHDSYIGPDIRYDYDYIAEYWQHFNYTYLVLFDTPSEGVVDALLGTDADARQNAVNALELARAEAVADQTDPFAWFNMGTSFVALGMMEEAAIAYDQARGLGLPWRMLWYQFGPYEAYNAVGRYDDTLALAQAALNDGGGHFVEETFYYGGVAREGKGERERALNNYISALQFNPNFTPALEARQRLEAAGG